MDSARTCSGELLLQTLDVLQTIQWQLQASICSGSIRTNGPGRATERLDGESPIVFTANDGAGAGFLSGAEFTETFLNGEREIA